jgi:hypothetical protein
LFECQRKLSGSDAALDFDVTIHNFPQRKAT